MTSKEHETMVLVAMALTPELIAATHPERVKLFRTLAESCPWNPEIWATGAAIILMMAPSIANRTSLIAAALEAAFDLGVAHGVETSSKIN
jgi:hypothetical protein